MRSPAKANARSILQDAHKEHRCLVPANESQQRMMRRAVALGVAVRPVPGVFADLAQWNKLNKKERALYVARALSAAHPDWVFACATAAAAHGLWVSYRRVSTLWRAVPSSSHASSSAHMRYIHARGDEPAMVAGVRVTSFARTVYDCLHRLPFPEALAVADSALRIGNVTRELLVDMLRQSCAHMPGLKRALQVVSLADGRSENGGESMARAQMIALGFVIPDLQREVSDPLNHGQTYRADFVWRLSDSTTVVAELDGRDKYVDPSMLKGDTIDALLAERRREARLTLSKQAVRVMRFSFAESQNRAYFERLLLAYGVPRAEVVPEVAAA